MKRFTVFLSLISLIPIIQGQSQSAPLKTQAESRESDVIYRKKQGVALTMDIFKPAKNNGAAVLWMVSGGWNSSHEAINPSFAKPFTDAGYTFIQVVHGSQPRYKIAEIVEDMNRAVRFVRYNAKRLNINPERIGISGGSAGGHLSLMIGSFGVAGNLASTDPIERESSRVQSVACFYPPTDFLNFGKEGVKSFDVPMLKGYLPAFGFTDSMSPADINTLASKVSPILGNLKQMPPTLIVHGTADLLVPIQQSERFVAAVKQAGRTAQLEVRPGKAHGWPGMESELNLFIKWFDTHMPAK